MSRSWPSRCSASPPLSCADGGRSQSNPYKLVILGRDYRPNLTTSANFLVNDGRLAFIMNDPKGVLRLFEYDPTSTSPRANRRR